MMIRLLIYVSLVLVSLSDRGHREREVTITKLNVRTEEELVRLASFLVEMRLFFFVLLKTSLFSTVSY